MDSPAHAFYQVFVVTVIAVLVLVTIQLTIEHISDFFRRRRHRGLPEFSGDSAQAQAARARWKPEPELVGALPRPVWASRA